jgi:hypothetical protein
MAFSIYTGCYIVNFRYHAVNKRINELNRSAKNETKYPAIFQDNDFVDLNILNPIKPTIKVSHGPIFKL